MKYLLRFIIWTFYLLFKVIWYLIYNFVCVIWDFSFDSIKYDYILNSRFYFKREVILERKWYYNTYFDALKDKKKYL